MVPLDMEFVQMGQMYTLLEIQTGMDSGMLNHPEDPGPSIGKIIRSLTYQVVR